MLLSLLRLSLILSITAWPFGKADQAPSSGPIKKTSYDLPSQPDAYGFIKILISNGVKEIPVASDSPYRFLDDQGRTILKGERLPVSQVSAQGGVLQIGSQPFHANPITIVNETHGVKIKGAWYRHALEIWRETNGTLTIINDIPIEDYLKGVLPSEVNPKWSMESLKAQAIASRTFALFKMIENQSQRYHLSKDVLSQVYGGKNLEHAMTTQAVETTQGQILTYQGKIFPAYFHSTCGGRTTHAEYLWPVEPHPSLMGGECNFCWKSKHYRWESEIPRQEIETKLQAHRIRVSDITNIRIEEKDETGRARYFVLTAAGKKVKVHSNDFRLWVDPKKFKSTWIQTIGKKKTAFVFRGRGWGHGVGLCQYGTKQLGEMGYSADKILKFYYPGAQVTQYWGAPPRSMESSFKNFISQIKKTLDLA